MYSIYVIKSIVLGAVIQLVSGTTYTVGAYSVELRSLLRLNQKSLVFIVFMFDLGLVQ